jgi:hypothetical protein
MLCDSGTQRRISQASYDTQAIGQPIRRPHRLQQHLHFRRTESRQKDLVAAIWQLRDIKKLIAIE